jgi:Cu+-exporting ATPase
VGLVEGRPVAVGSAALLRELGVDPGPVDSRADALGAQGYTPMHVAVHGRLAGLIAVADPVKLTSRAAVEELRRLGLETVMLTGDNRRAAESVAREVGLSRVIAEVHPDRKLVEIRRCGRKGRVVAWSRRLNDAGAWPRPTSSPWAPHQWQWRRAPSRRAVTRSAR